MAGEELTISIRAKNLTQKALSAAGVGIRKFGRASFNVFKRLAKGAAALAVSLAGAGAWFVKGAADAEETESKFAAVFKNLTSEAETWAGEFGAAVNRNKTAIQGWMSTLQDTFVPLGFTREKSLDLSKQLTKLTVDLSSFNNVAESDVLRDLQSAMVGNHETMRKYGVILTETSVKQEAVNLGLADSTKSVSDAAKVQARYSLIMKGTTDAQGDAERTSGSFTNQMRGLQSAVKDGRIAIGKAIMESASLSDIVSSLTTKVKALTTKFKEWAKSGGLNKLTMDVQLFGANFAAIFTKAWAFVKGFFGGLYQAGSAPFRYLGKVIGNFANLVVAEFTYVNNLVSALTEKLKHPFKVKFTMPSTSEVTEALKGLFSSATRGVDTTSAFIGAGETWHAADAKLAARLAKIRAQYFASEEKDAAKDVADTVSALDAENTETDKEKKKDAVAEVAEKAAALSTENIDADLAQQLENVSTVAKAKEAAEIAVGERVAKAAATSASVDTGKAYTVEQFDKYGGTTLAMAASAEASRIKTIMKALKGEGTEADPSLKQIAKHTASMDKTLEKAISMG